MHHERVAVGQRHHHGRVGGQVGQAVARLQVELVVADQRVVLDQHVRARARVVREAGQRERLGPGVPAVRRGRLEHQHLEPRAGEVAGADERVVAGPDHHDLGLVGQLEGQRRRVGDGRVVHGLKMHETALVCKSAVNREQGSIRCPRVLDRMWRHSQDCA